MHAYAYICVYTVYAYARVHICIIVYISTAIIRENRRLCVELIRRLLKTIDELIRRLDEYLVAQTEIANDRLIGAG